MNRVQVEDRVSADRRSPPLLPPSRVVAEAEALLPPQAQVLDLGAYNGRNGIYLAARGHLTDSVEINPAYVAEGELIARGIGGTALSGNRFILEDMRAFRPVRSYDAVLATTSLQHITPWHEADVVMKTMRGAVAAGGLNVIEAYIASADQQRQKPDYSLFEEDELREIYIADGWEILKYETTGILPLTPMIEDGNARSSVHSLARMIAREVSREKTKRELLKRAEYYRRTDSELSGHLADEAAAL